jgi:hypothetical protein
MFLPVHTKSLRKQSESIRQKTKKINQKIGKKKKEKSNSPNGRIPHKWTKKQHEYRRQNNHSKIQRKAVRDENYLHNSLRVALLGLNMMTQY